MAKAINMTLKPLKVNDGIIFKRVDLKLLISLALNCFLINQIYKFKQTITAYKVYADGLYTKLNDIQQKSDKLGHNIKDVIKNSVKKK